MLINNVQQLRIQLEKLFEAMGGEKLEKDTSDILTELQQTLNGVIDDLSCIFARSLYDTVKASCQQMGVLLFQVKNTNAAQSKQALKNNAEISQHADQILQPLMDFLDNKLGNYADICERTIFKRVLKELWKIVINFIEKSIVLPPMEKGKLMQNLPNAKIEDVSRLLKTSKLPTLNMIEVSRHFMNISV